MGKSIIEQSKENVKNKQKKEKEMKNIRENSKVKTTLTVIITLVSVAALVAAFLAGMSYQKSINDDVTSRVKDVVSAIHVEPSKESQ